MAVVLTQQVSADEILGIWKITETEDEFRERLHATPWIDNMLEGVTHPVKRLEYLASRFLTEHLTSLLGLPFGGIYKDKHGKPHPLLTGAAEKGQPDPYFISLSHSFPYAASCIHKKKTVGIDIERPKEKFVRVSRKYLNEKELKLAKNDEKTLCLMWAVKEAIYKMNGKTGMSFKQDMMIAEVINTQKQVLAGANLNGKIEQLYIDYFSFEGNIIAFTR